MEKFLVRSIDYDELEDGYDDFLAAIRMIRLLDDILGEPNFQSRLLWNQLRKGEWFQPDRRMIKEQAFVERYFPRLDDLLMTGIVERRKFGRLWAYRISPQGQDLMNRLINFLKDNNDAKED